MDEQLIKQIVIQTIQELKRSGMLKSVDELAYSDISSVLAAYYDGGEQDAEVRAAVERLRGDTYYKILPLYFGYKYTIEQIAEEFGVEVSTIVRNKKRLCLQVYNAIQ